MKHRQDIAHTRSAGLSEEGRRFAKLVGTLTQRKILDNTKRVGRGPWATTSSYRHDASVPRGRPTLAPKSSSVESTELDFSACTADPIGPRAESIGPRF